MVHEIQEKSLGVAGPVIQANSVPFQRSSLAWFKLAEFVNRKEKERAISMYRLLSYSLPSEACASQLEGDLFMAFNDEKAFDSYIRAAALYEKQGDHMLAAMLYEQLMLLVPENKDFFHQAFKLYQEVKNSEKITRCAIQLIRMLARQKLFTSLEELVQQLEALPSLDAEHLICVYENLIISCIQHVPEAPLERFFKQLFDIYLLQQGQSHRVNIFLGRIAVLSADWHARAEKCITSL